LAHEAEFFFVAPPLGTANVLLLFRSSAAAPPINRGVWVAPLVRRTSRD